MLKKITYKGKVQILLVSIILIILIVNNLAINRTVNLKQQCDALYIKLEDAKEFPLEVNKISTRLKLIEDVVGKNILDGDDIQERLLERTADYCTSNNLLLKNLPRPHRYSINGYEIETCILEIEGGYKKLLKLVYLFEQKYHLGRIVSLNFYKEEDRVTKKNRLLVKIYIQNIKIEKDEAKN